jgi:hypothetical protein
LSDLEFDSSKHKNILCEKVKEKVIYGSKVIVLRTSEEGERTFFFLSSLRTVKTVGGRNGFSMTNFLTPQQQRPIPKTDLTEMIWLLDEPRQRKRDRKEDR